MTKNITAATTQELFAKSWDNDYLKAPMSTNMGKVGYSWQPHTNSLCEVPKIIY